MFLAVRLEWVGMIGQSQTISKVTSVGHSVQHYCNGNVMNEFLTPVEGSLFKVNKPAFQRQSLKVVGVEG